MYVPRSYSMIATDFFALHSRSGGGTVPNQELKRRTAPLRWMVYEAVGAGLRMDLVKGWTEEQPPIEFHESLTGIWWLLEVLPIKRLTYKSRDGITWLWVLILLCVKPPITHYTYILTM